MLIPFVGVATLLSGSVFWLRRVGWLQADKFWISNSDLIVMSPHPDDINEIYRFVMQHHASLHQLDGWFQLSKFAKEAVLAAFALLALTQLTKRRLARPFGAAFGGLFLLGAISATTTLLAGRWLALLAGGRSFIAWFMGATASLWADGELRQRLARTCAWVLVVQAVLLPVELRRGLLIYVINLGENPLPRIVGTFNLPISLGSFAVVAWATALCWGGYGKRGLSLLTLALLLVLVFNASASAWVAFALLLFSLLFARLRERARLAVLACLLPLALLGWQLLPTLTGRFDVHDSLWGRIVPVQLYAQQHLSSSQVLFGTGFGLGTNALGSHQAGTTFVRSMPDRPVGDSLPAVLFWQVGLVGLGLGYGLFLLALRTDPASRPIGIALLVCSIAVNITELFPVNLVLGFWLAGAAARKDADGAA